MSVSMYICMYICMYVYCMYIIKTWHYGSKFSVFMIMLLNIDKTKLKLNCIRNY